VLRFQVSVAGAVNDAHSALPQTPFELVFALQHRLAADGVEGRHAVFGTSGDFIGITTLTLLALFHLFVRLYEKLRRNVLENFLFQRIANPFGLDSDSPFAVRSFFSKLILNALPIAGKAKQTA
jgi:hypothetical protein